MRRKQRFALNLRVDEIENAGSDGHAFLHAGSSPQFIDKNQRTRCGLHSTNSNNKTIAENRSRFANLRVKRASIVQNIVGTANTTKDLIHRSDFASRSGDEASHLPENHTQRDRAKQRGFPSHIRSRNDAGANSLLAYEENEKERKRKQSMWRELGMNVLPCFCFIIMSSTTRWRTSVSESVEATRE